MISESVLQKATERLVSRFHPEKITLFGSQARGDATERSDDDITLSDAACAIEIADIVQSRRLPVLKAGIRQEYENQKDEEIRREYEQIEFLNE